MDTTTAYHTAYDKATPALTLGIISLLLNILFVPGILAIVFGCKTCAAQPHGNRSYRKAKTGMICGIIGSAVSVVWFLWVAAA